MNKNILITKEGKVFINGVQKKECIRPDGYIQVCIYDINKKKSHKQYVHRLVALQYLPNPNNFPQVNHKDCNKSNNNVDNLEWCTAKQNMKHALENNLYKWNRGKDNIKSKQVLQYDLDNNFVKEWGSTGEIQRTLGIKKQLISGVCNGNHHTTHNFIFRWKE